MSPNVTLARAASIRPSVTSTICSRLATAMRSSGVCTSIIPLQRLTAGKPLRMKALTSEPPPLGTRRGVWPERGQHRHGHRHLRVALADR